MTVSLNPMLFNKKFLSNHIIIEKINFRRHSAGMSTSQKTSNKFFKLAHYCVIKLILIFFFKRMILTVITAVRTFTCMKSMNGVLLWDSSVGFCGEKRSFKIILIMF